MNEYYVLFGSQIQVKANFEHQIVHILSFQFAHSKVIIMLYMTYPSRLSP